MPSSTPLCPPPLPYSLPLSPPTAPRLFRSVRGRSLYFLESSDSTTENEMERIFGRTHAGWDRHQNTPSPWAAPLALGSRLLITPRPSGVGRPRRSVGLTNTTSPKTQTGDFPETPLHSQAPAHPFYSTHLVGVLCAGLRLCERHWCSLVSTLGATMNDILHLSALGRPFQLGMLYDCRSDSLIPGITLWDLQTLQSNLNSQDQPSTEMHIIASDSMEEKANALSVSGSLKASFLGGLMEVKGSAKYLSDTKGSVQQARVTLQYKGTIRFDQLTMSHLGRQNITYPSVFDEGSATHVVTAVLYGAHAFFVVDQITSSTENLRDIQGNMEAMVKCLPMIAIQGEASLKMTDEQKSKAKKFSCTFYGDFSLKNNPTTFQEVINIYTSLPSLLGSGGEHSVLITVLSINWTQKLSIW
ncbi:verrucotoxin subunit beta-like [Narcine bancroftii]|uniref:verrucotoxin subunit beta-like n=1 Tax=Narcine bancroftii TaxID=1343680 RepID=UPI0038310CE2